MEEILHYTELYDLYKGLLTEKQQETFKDYFEENLTLEEIAFNNGISKNAVSKTVIGIKETLDNYESNIKMKKYIDSIKDEFKDDEDILLRIAKYDSIIL